MNIQTYIAPIMIAVLTSLVISMIYSKKSNFKRISKTTLASALVGVMVVSIVLTSPTIADTDPVNGETTISTITSEFVVGTQETTIKVTEPDHDDPDPWPPTEIVVQIGTELVTFSDLTIIGTQTEGPYVLVDKATSETLTFYQNTHTPDEGDAYCTWALLLPDGSFAPVHDPLTMIESTDLLGPYEVDENGVITMDDPLDGPIEVQATNTYSVETTGVDRLLFSLHNPGVKLWIGPDADEQVSPRIDGNDLIAAYQDPITGDWDNFEIVFDLDLKTDPAAQISFDIDAVSAIKVDGECTDLIFSVERDGSILTYSDGTTELSTKGATVPAGGSKTVFENTDLLKYDITAETFVLWWDASVYVTKGEKDIDAVAVGDFLPDATADPLFDGLEILFSIKTPASGGGSTYPDGSGGDVAPISKSDIILFDYEASGPSYFFDEFLEEADHFDYHHAPDNVDALAISKLGGDLNMLLLSFVSEWYEAGLGDTPMQTYREEDVILYETSSKQASMYFDGSDYFHQWVGGEPKVANAELDAVTECVGTLVTYYGFVIYYTAEGYALVFDIRGERELTDEIVYYIVKRTTETEPRTPEIGEVAQFITCYNYTNSTTTITLEYTTITSTYEVCADTTTTTEVSIYASIVYSNLVASNGSYMPLLIIGLLGFLWLYNFTRDRKSNKTKTKERLKKHH